MPAARRRRTAARPAGNASKNQLSAKLELPRARAVASRQGLTTSTIADSGDEAEVRAGDVARRLSPLRSIHDARRVGSNLQLPTFAEIEASVQRRIDVPIART